MKTFGSLVLGLSLVVVLGLTAMAEDKKEVTVKGSLVCGKCELKMTDACSNAIKVTEKVDGKDTEVIYWLKDEGKTEKYHACTAPKKASVTGTVSEKDGKKWITPSKDGVKLD